MILFLRNVSCKPFSSCRYCLYPFSSVFYGSIGNNNLLLFQSGFDGAVFTVWCNFLNIFVKFIAFDSVFWTLVCKISFMRWLLFFQIILFLWGQVTCPRTSVEIRCFIDFLLINYLPLRFRYPDRIIVAAFVLEFNFWSSRILSHLPLVSTLYL